MKKLLAFAAACLLASGLALADNQPTPTKAPAKTEPAKAEPTKAPTKEEKAPPLYSLDTAIQPNPPANSALARVLNSQLLRVCVRSDVPPFGYFNSSNLTGFDIDLGTEIATRLSIDYKKNLHIRWTVITAGDRITSLQQNHCDLVIAAFSYTPARATQVSFSHIYLKTDKVLVAAEKITRTTPVIAQVKGTTGQLKDIKGAVRYFNSYRDIIFAMENGEVDYIIADRPVALHMIRSVTSSFSISKTLAKDAEPYAIGINKSHNHLTNAVNKALLDLANSGRLAFLHRQWL